MLIGFECFFGCLWLCLINTEGNDTKNACTGGAYVRGTYTGGVCIRGACIRVIFIKGTCYVRSIGIKGTDMKRACIQGTCLCNTCLGSAYTRGTSARVIYAGSACIESIGTIKHFGIHLQSSQIIEVGRYGTKLETGIGAGWWSLRLLRI